MRSVNNLPQNLQTTTEEYGWRCPEMHWKVQSAEFSVLWRKKRQAFTGSATASIAGRSAATEMTSHSRARVMLKNDTVFQEREHKTEWRHHTCRCSSACAEQQEGGVASGAAGSRVRPDDCALLRAGAYRRLATLLPGDLFLGQLHEKTVFNRIFYGEKKDFCCKPFRLTSI